jgi:hypothetical protein
MQRNLKPPRLLKKDIDLTTSPLPHHLKQVLLKQRGQFLLSLRGNLL